MENSKRSFSPVCINKKTEALQVSVALGKSLLRFCFSSPAPFSFVLGPCYVQG